MTAGRRWITYRKTLKTRAQSLRRDPTPAERKLWYEFLRDLPEKFTRQKPLGTYVADFYCSRHQLVIELDGDSHYVEKAQKYDEARTSVLGLQGIQVIRFANDDVMQNFEAVCAAILAVLKQSPQT
jgi:very-short-patch-repair endonuclease